VLRHARIDPQNKSFRQKTAEKYWRTPVTRIEIDNFVYFVPDQYFSSIVPQQKTGNRAMEVIHR